MTARDKDPKRVGHITPRGMSVLDDLNLDPEFAAEAKQKIYAMKLAETLALLGHPVPLDVLEPVLLAAKVRLAVERPFTPSDPSGASLPPEIDDQTRPVYKAACDLLKTMGNEAVAQLLREIAAEIDRGDVAHDPWGPEDSRSPALRAEILKRRRRKR